MSGACRDDMDFAGLIAAIRRHCSIRTMHDLFAGGLSEFPAQRPSYALSVIFVAV